MPEELKYYAGWLAIVVAIVLAVWFRHDLNWWRSTLFGIILIYGIYQVAKGKR